MTKWDGLLVMSSGANWDGMATPPKEMALQLARSGPVLYVDPPRSFISARRRSQRASGVPPVSGVHEVADGLARLTPYVQPGIDRPGFARLTELLVKRQMQHAVDVLGGKVDAVIVANQRDVFAELGERRRVVFATDDFVAGADLMGVRMSVLVAQQRRQARHAHLIACVSPQIEEQWKALGVPTALLPNGCEPDRFAAIDDTPYAETVHLQPPIVGFVGHISARIDVTLFDAVARTGVSLLLVGPRQPVAGLDEILARPNVQWIDQQPLEALPSYLRWIDVGLTPYANTAFNRGSFPMKTLEYLAAGRRVVATGLPATHWLDTDLVVIADQPDEFASAVARELARPHTHDELQRRLAFAVQHSWAERANELRRLLTDD